MLDNWNRPKRPVDAEIDEGVEEAKKRLADIQIQVKEKKLPKRRQGQHYSNTLRTCRAGTKLVWKIIKLFFIEYEGDRL